MIDIQEMLDEVEPVFTQQLEPQFMENVNRFFDAWDKLIDLNCRDPQVETSSAQCEVSH